MKKLFFCLLSCYFFAVFSAEKKEVNQVKTTKIDLVGVATTVKIDDSFDTQPMLRIILSGLSNKDYLSNAEDFLEVFKERDKPIKNPLHIRYLIDTGVKQIQQALQPFGYYLAQVKAQVSESKNQWSVHYQIQLGKPVRVSKSNIIIFFEPLISRV